MINTDKHRHGINCLKKRSQAIGGDCLEEKYLGYEEKHKFSCQQGHIWDTTASSILRNKPTWCPYCRRSRVTNCKTTEFSISQINEIIEKRGGKLLQKFEGSSKKYIIECGNSHRTSMILSNITKHNNWCWFCRFKLKQKNSESPQEYTIRIFNEIAEKNNGKFIKKKGSKVNFTCSKFHNFYIYKNNLKYKNQWCPKCFEKNKKIGTIEKAKAIAIDRGGLCLSKIYRGPHINLIWQCSFKHKWKAGANRVRRGNWCPKCSKSKSEEICRFIFETLYQVPFRSIFPKWLINITNKPLQLDGYNKSINISFEYQGEQHFKSYDHLGGDKTLLAIMKRDRFKVEKCKEKGVPLVIIPSFKFNWSQTKIINTVLKCIEKTNLEYPKERVPVELNKMAIYNSKNSYQLELFI